MRAAQVFTTAGDVALAALAATDELAAYAAVGALLDEVPAGALLDVCAALGVMAGRRGSVLVTTVLLREGGEAG